MLVGTSTHHPANARCAMRSARGGDAHGLTVFSYTAPRLVWFGFSPWSEELTVHAEPHEVAALTLATDAAVCDFRRRVPGLQMRADGDG